MTEEITSELRAVIDDDAVGDPKIAHEALDELDHRASWNGADGFNLRPLSELVDGDVDVSIAPRHPRKQAQNIQSPYYERPREWNGLEALSWLMDLLGMELAGLIGLHQLSHVVEHRRPVESTSECLADEGS